MPDATIRETCSCGATFQATASMLTVAEEAAANWRTGHQHAESVGICGNQPKATLPDGEPLTCTLKAGHTGWHSNGSGSWIERAEKEASDGPR